MKCFSFRIRRKDKVGMVVVKYVYGLKMTLYVKITHYYWYKAFFECACSKKGKNITLINRKNKTIKIHASAKRSGRKIHSSHQG